MANILIVEDEPSLQKAYDMVLSAHGFQIVTANNGQEAFEKLKDFTPDLILLDMNMPVMDGLEFMEIYRQQENGCRVILLSNFSNSDNIDRIMELGVYQRLLKADVSPQELVEIVKLNTNS